MTTNKARAPVKLGSEIRVRDIALSYATRGGEMLALSECSMTVPGGAFGCLVGPSGCGKSTLLDLVAGLVPRQTGLIEMDLGKGGAVARLAVVFQRPALFPWKTVQANVNFGLKALGLARSEIQARTDRYLNLVGLSGFANAYPHELSGGMAQRVGIARALALEPDILLMDEPFAAVDAQTRTQLQEELRRITAGSSMTVLFVTHDVGEAVYLGDMVFVMSGRPGKILREISPSPEQRDRASGAFAGLTAEIFELLAHAPAGATPPIHGASR